MEKKKTAAAWLLGRRVLAVVGVSAMLSVSSLAMAQITKETKTTTETTSTRESTAPNGAASSGSATSTNGAASANGAASTNGAADSAAKRGTKQQADMKSPPADMHSAMTASDEKMKSMQMTGNIDRDYATMMRAHHQGAVDMSQSVLTHGKDPEMKRMARKIINNNKKEMGQFDKWLNKQRDTKKGANGQSME